MIANRVYPSRCVILPCGGTGSRLGLPYPKELHVVLPGKPLIDLSLELLEALTPRPALLIIVSPSKLELVQYLSRRCRLFDFQVVVQTTPGFLGALYNTVSHLGDFNLVLLPDQAIKEEGAIENLFECLEGGAPVAFLAHHRADPATLADEGALLTNDQTLIEMAEKPGTNFHRYNAAWCGIGFRKEAAIATLDVLKNAYTSGSLSQKDVADSPLYAAPVFFVEEYLDLGTWERLTAYQRARI